MSAKKEPAVAKKDKLRATWSRKRDDMILHFPLGQSTTSDGHWLAGVLDKGFREELVRRGYDVTTMRFSVAPERGNQRFASQRVGRGGRHAE